MNSIKYKKLVESFDKSIIKENFQNNDVANYYLEKDVIRDIDEQLVDHLVNCSDIKPETLLKITEQCSDVEIDLSDDNYPTYVNDMCKHINSCKSLFENEFFINENGVQANGESAKYFSDGVKELSEQYKLNENEKDISDINHNIIYGELSEEEISMLHNMIYEDNDTDYKPRFRDDVYKHVCITNDTPVHKLISDIHNKENKLSDIVKQVGLTEAKKIQKRGISIIQNGGSITKIKKLVEGYSIDTHKIKKLVEGEKYNINTQFLHDWVLDTGYEVKKGQKVNIDILDDDKNTNFSLIPVRINNKHVGYAESTHPNKMFKLSESSNGSEMSDKELSDLIKETHTELTELNKEYSPTSYEIQEKLTEKLKLTESSLNKDFILKVMTEVVELVHVYDDKNKKKLFGTGEISKDNGVSKKIIDGVEHTFVRFDSTKAKWIPSDRVALTESISDNLKNFISKYKGSRIKSKYNNMFAYEFLNDNMFKNVKSEIGDMGITTPVIDNDNNIVYFHRSSIIE